MTTITEQHLEKAARAMYLSKEAMDSDVYVSSDEHGLDDITVDGSVNFIALARAAALAFGLEVEES